MIYRIHFVISNLGPGGAELMLYKLLSRIDRGTFAPEITSLTDFVPLAEKFRDIEVPVHILGMARGVPDPRGLLRLSRTFRSRRPHLVQTWMYHADLMGGVAAKLAGRIPVVWNIRHSNLEPRSSKPLTRITAKACARLSACLPEKIICCAEAARQVHVDLGYAPAKLQVIPNGFDLEAFKPCPAAKPAVAQELGIPAAAPIIGLVARFHPEKDHRSFVQAAAQLSLRRPDVHFVLCGGGTTWENKELAAWIDAAGMRQVFHLLGQRTDIPRLAASFDIAASASVSEGFSNTIGEAMACGVPCAVTNVGDSAFIVGDTGRVVPSGNPQALSNAWHELLELGAEGRQRLGQAARQRILKHFALGSIVNQYETLYQEVLHPAPKTID